VLTELTTARRANHFRFTEIVSSPEIKNISLYQKRDSGYISCIPSRPEGRIMIVTNVGRGAVDAEVPKTNGADAYGKDVWS
jgi:hypothetical protein